MDSYNPVPDILFLAFLGICIYIYSRRYAMAWLWLVPLVTILGFTNFHPAGNVLCIAVACFIIHLYRKEKNKEREDRERSKREVLERIAKKRSREERIGELVARSQTLSQELFKEVDGARNTLNTAEREYKDNAFAPFWDAIEWAVTHLARFNGGVKQLTQNCAEYQTEIRQLDSVPSSLPALDWKRVIDTPDAITTANRLRVIVRNAQKNFQFAVIYEQRKTNQLLAAGFANLAQALSEIAYRIDESTTALLVSVDNLSSTVSDASARTIEAGREDTRAAIKSTQAIKEQLVVDAQARKEHERKELEMLDNIQRRQLP